MYFMDPGLGLVLVTPVSALLAVVHPAGLILATDRAAIDPSREIADGALPVLEDQPKLFSEPGRGVLALAGRASVGEGFDLRSVLPALCLRHDSPFDAAGKVVAVFDSIADLFRDRASTEAIVVPPFVVPVISIAVVAGCSTRGPVMYAVGMTLDGPSKIVQVDPPGVAFGPLDIRADLSLSVLTAAEKTTLDAALEDLSEAVRSAAIQNPQMVSADWDHVVVDTQGSSGITRHPKNKWMPPYGS